MLSPLAPVCPPQGDNAFDTIANSKNTNVKAAINLARCPPTAFAIVETPILDNPGAGIEQCRGKLERNTVFMLIGAILFRIERDHRAHAASASA